MTYFKLTKNDVEKDTVVLKYHVFNKVKDYPSIEYDLVYLKNASGKKSRVLEGDEPGLIPREHRMLDEIGGKEIMICFIHQHNKTMFMNYLIHGEQSGMNKFEMHELYRDENSKFSFLIFF